MITVTQIHIVFFLFFEPNEMCACNNFFIHSRYFGSCYELTCSSKKDEFYWPSCFIRF